MFFLNVKTILEQVLKFYKIVLFNPLERTDLKRILELILNDSYFRFDNTVYKQIAGLAIWGQQPRW